MAEAKSFIRKNLPLLIIIAVGLVTACVVARERAVTVESRDKSFDIVLDYQETESMAAQDGVDVSVWLARFGEMGIDKVGLAEESLKSLQEGGELPVSSELMFTVTQDARWRERYPAEWIGAVEEFGYGRYDVMVEMRSKDAYDFVAAALQNRVESDGLLLFPAADGGYALLTGSSGVTLYAPRYQLHDSSATGFMQRMDPEDSKLRLMSLGILPEKAEKIRALGLDIVPRAYCYSSLNGEKFARAVIDGYRDSGIYGSQPSYFLAGGEAVPGYDDGVDLIDGYIAEKGLSVCLIEDTTQLQNIKQDGVLDLVGRGRGAVRVFSVWDYIQNRYQYYGYEGAKEIENTLFRAVTERNIRVIYYKPIREFKDFHTYVTDADEYVEMFANLRERLAEHGITLGSAPAMPDFSVSFASKLLIALGCAASGILLLGIIFPVPERWKLILMVAAALCVLGSFYVLPNTTELIASLMNALIFACLAVTVCVKAARMAYDGGGDAAPPVLNAVINGILALFAVTAVALAGGIMTAAPLSSVSYMLEIDIFRGVKVAQILPLVFFVGAYLAFFGSGETSARRSVLRLGDVKSLLDTKINVWMAIIAVAAAVAGQYYLMRTGHESVEVSGVEMLFRNTLEELLLARPRTKEFLAGFPAVMLTVYAAGRRLRFWTVAFGLCGVIGATSVINTFMHIRTPLYLGFARTGFSVFFGAIAGIAAVLIFHALFAAYRALKKRYGGKA